MGFEQEVSKFERKNPDGDPAEYTLEEVEALRRQHRRGIKDAIEESARRGVKLHPRVAAIRAEREARAKLGVDAAHSGCDKGTPR